MTNPVLILYLEDNPRDAELVRDKLQQASLVCELRVVIDRAEYEAALAQTRFDLILSDYNLPDYDGMAALALARAKQPDVPFVLVSGTLGEEKAVDCVLRGATDYVLKQRLDRLVPSVLRALTEAEERRKRREAEEALRESEVRHRTILATALDGFWLVDMQGRLHDVNGAYSRMSGYSRQELLAMRIFDLEAMESTADTDARIERIRAHGADRFESRHRRKDGSVIDVEISVQVQQMDGGRMVVFSRDITERKRADEALRESEEKFRGLFESSLDAIMTLEPPSWRFTSGNPATVAMFGAKNEEEFISHGPWELSPERQPDGRASAEKSKEMLETVLREGSHFFEWTHRRIGGEEFSANVLMTRMKQGGKVVLQATVRDITERKQREAVLSFLAQYNSVASGEEFFAVLARYLAENLGVDYVCIDWLEGDGLTARTVAVWCDDKFEDNVTYALKDTPCGEVVGKTVCCFPANVCQFFPRDKVLKDLRAESYIGVTLWSHTGQPIGLIAVIGRRPLANRPLAEAMLNLVAVRAAGELERKLAEENLVSERRLLRTVIDNLPDAICAKDLEGRKTLANRADLANIGVASEADVLGKVDSDLFPPEVAARFLTDDLAVMQSGKLLLNVEELLVDANGNRRWLLRSTIPLRNLAGHVVGLVGIVRDITERKQAEEEKAKLEDQFRQAQKMESVGRLAGGVAHDFNNLLTGIMGYVELCQDRIEPSHPIREWLDEILRDAQRSAEITRQLLAFARKQVIVPRVLDLNDAVAGMLNWLRRLIGEDINLAWLPGADLRPVRLDPSQVDQILANLCINARDAIAGVGKITLETGNITIDADYCARHAEAIPGKYAFLAASDDGCGMDPETMAQIFEPFFTTKGIGKGTGLGLATVYGIVKQNNGFIYTYSEPGRGTTFKIYLPQVAAEAVETPVTSKAEVPKGRGETILLVEDEKSLRVTCSLFLEAFGYNVLVAETPGEALKMADRYPGDIHLLLTDVVMPGMDGPQLAKRLGAVKSGLKVLFMSGYTADVMVQRGVQEHELHFLAKPFMRDDLVRKVREVLEGD